MSKQFIRKVQVHGTSLVIAIPLEIRKEGRFERGDDLILDYADGKITITHPPDHHAVKCHRCDGTGVVLVKKNKR